MNKKLKQDFKDFKKKNNLNIQNHVAIKNELMKFAKEKPKSSPHK